MERAVEVVLQRYTNTSGLDRLEYQQELLQSLQPVLDSKPKILGPSINLPETVFKVFVEGSSPVEALSFAIELFKSAESDSLRYKLAKALVTLWLKENCCAEAFLRYSTLPIAPAESANFCRHLFTIAESFHLNRQDFVRLVTDQILLAIQCLSKLTHQGSVSEIRTVLLSTVLDRLFLRFHTDEENFYPQFSNEDLLVLDLDDKDAFLTFAVRANEVVEHDFVSRRLLGKTLLQLGQSTAAKFARLTFVAHAATQRSCSLLHPREDFQQNSETWKHVLLSSVPFKSRIVNLPFFWCWARFMISSNSEETILSIWTDITAAWSRLMLSPALDAKTMLSSTCALVALAKAINQQREENCSSAFRTQLRAQTISTVFTAAQKCLESTDVERQACGMTVMQVTASLCDAFEPTAKVAEGNQAEGNASNKLKFESEHSFFLKCTNFYEDAEPVVVAKPAHKTVPRLRSFHTNLDELDSDDEEAPGSGPIDEDDLDEPGFEPYDMSNDRQMPESLNSSSNLRKEIPNYISEIYEILTEGQSTKDEAAQEKLKQIAVLRIPVLLEKKVQVDSAVCRNLARAVAELEGGGLMEIPVICGLYEFAKLQPAEVFPTLGQMAFDKDHYSVGHRMTTIARTVEVVQLLSDQKCFACFTEETGRLFKTLEGIHAPFIVDYLRKKQLERKCVSCLKMEPNQRPQAAQGSQVQVTAPDKNTFVEENRNLTWREVVEKRVAAKTRRFGLKRSPATQKIDIYSSQLVPIIWASLANRLVEEAPLLVNASAAEYLAFSLFTAQVLRALGIIVLGTAGVFCPHLRNIASQTSTLITLYAPHPESDVRRSVLSLLGIVISKSEGHGFILDIFGDLIDQIVPVFENDPDSENRQLFAQLKKLITASVFVQLGKAFSD